MTIPELGGAVEKAGKIRPELEPQKAAKIHEIWGTKSLLVDQWRFQWEKTTIYIYISIRTCLFSCYKLGPCLASAEAQSVFAAKGMSKWAKPVFAVNRW